MKIEVLDKGYVRLVDVLGDDLSVVNAARVSFDKESSFVDGELQEKDKKLLQFLIRENHSSPFRHAAITFEIYSPLMVARQHWKYAVASTFVEDQAGWNESSRRYVTEEPEFYIPSNWRSAPDNKKQGSGKDVESWLSNEMTEALVEYIDRGVDLYNEAIQNNVAVEQARLFLPSYGMYVRYRWTTSLAAVINFLEQRLEHDAQKEIQEYAKAILELVKTKFPYSVKAILDK